jgi:hypothetical protein
MLQSLDHHPIPREAFFLRELLLIGVQSGVGDGKAIKITSDNWILDRPPYMVNPLKPIMNHATIDCFFDEETREWIPRRSMTSLIKK